METKLKKKKCFLLPQLCLVSLLDAKMNKNEQTPLKKKKKMTTTIIYTVDIVRQCRQYRGDKNGTLDRMPEARLLVVSS